MKLMKKAMALVIVFIMAFSITGCHKKDEIAVTIEGFEFTSAYYMCALVNAYSEAKTTISEDKGSTTSEINYFKEKIDDKSFETWVKDRAIEVLEEIAAYKKICKDNKVEMDKVITDEAEYMAYYYWYNYGYSSYFEPNGVSYNTYKQYITDGYYMHAYFESLYNEGGKKEIPSADVEKKLYDNFIIADIIDVTFSEETDKEKDEIKAKLDAYVADLNSKKKTFEEVYNDYNGIKEEEDKKDETTSTDSTTSDTSSDTEATDDDDHDHDEHSEPVDKYAQILGAKDSGYDYDYFSEINKMATDEVKIITKASKGGYVLVVKKDIKADEYYRETLDLTVRHLLKDDEFTKDMEKVIEKTKAEVNSYAVDRFKVKKIKEPSYS